MGGLKAPFERGLAGGSGDLPTASFATAGQDFQARLAALIDRFDSRQAAARAAGRSDDQIIAYAKGRAAPSFETVVRLAMAQGVSLDWLATGIGPVELTARAVPCAGFRENPDHYVSVPVLAGAILAFEGVLETAGPAGEAGMLPAPGPGQAPSGSRGLRAEQRADAIARLYSEVAAKSDALVQAMLRDDPS